MSHTLTRSDLEAVGRMLSKNYGVRVVVGGSRAYTDGKTIYLPDIPSDLRNPRLLSLVRFFLDHEAGHIVGQSDTAVLKDIDQNHGEEAANILNALEDVRVESIMAEQWAGCGININDGLDALIPSLKGGADQSKEASARAVYIAGKRRDPLENTPPEIQAVVDKHRDEILATADRASQTADLADLAVKLANEFEQQRQQRQQRQQSPDGKQGGEGGDGKSPEGKGDPNGGDQNQQGKNQQGKGPESDEKKQEQKTPQNQQEKTKEKPAETTTSTKTQAQNGAGTSTAGFDVSKHAADEANKEIVGQRKEQTCAWRPPLPGADIVVDVDFYINSGGLAAVKDGAYQWLRDALRYGSPARQRLLQSLLSERKDGWRCGRARGIPDMARMASLALSLNDRAMKARTHTESPNTSVLMLIDASGSMGDMIASTTGRFGRRKRSWFSARVAASFATMIEAAGHECYVAAMPGIFTISSHAIPLEYHRWDRLPSVYRRNGYVLNTGNLTEDGYRDSTHILIRFKDWAQRCRDRAMQFRVLSEFHRSGTPLADAVYHAGCILRQRQSRRKVMMVYTDGVPDCGGQHLRHVIPMVESWGIEVSLVGIQLNEYTLETLQLSHPGATIANVSDIDKLGPTTIKQLSEALKRR